MTIHFLHRPITELKTAEHRRVAYSQVPALTKARATMSNLEVTLTPSEGPPSASRCPFHETVGSTGSEFVWGQPVGVRAASPFVSLSKFVVANDKMADVKEAFRHRPHVVDEQPGFVQMEVFSPLDRPEILHRCGADLILELERVQPSEVTNSVRGALSKLQDALTEAEACWMTICASRCDKLSCNPRWNAGRSRWRKDTPRLPLDLGTRSVKTRAWNSLIAVAFCMAPSRAKAPLLPGCPAAGPLKKRPTIPGGRSFHRPKLASAGPRSRVQEVRHS
jgi:hypothetical protein